MGRMRAGGRKLAAIVAALILVAVANHAPAFAQAGTAVPGWTVEVSQSKPAVTRAQLSTTGDLTRLAFDLTERLTPKVATVTNPDRVIVDLPEVEFRLDAASGQNGKGLVKAYRFGLFQSKQSRIVIDTDGPVLVKTARVEGRNQPRLVIELTRAKSGQPTAPTAQLTPPDLRPSRFEEPPTLVAASNGRPVIVIDPGHGGLDPGAVGPNGLLEKDVVLSVARRLKALLDETGRYAVVLTRNRDIFVPLQQRVNISRRHKADLFISLHADAVPEESLASLVRGASIYTLSEFASNEQARRLAEKENSVDLLAGLAPASLEAQDEVRNILIDLLRRETETFSAEFSNLLTNELRKHMKLARDPQRSAAFLVLQQTESPSVLVELGYMSNEEDQKLLKSPEWQTNIARAILAAVDAFFARRAMGAVHVP